MDMSHFNRYAKALTLCTLIAAVSQICMQENRSNGCEVQDMIKRKSGFVWVTSPYPATGFISEIMQTLVQFVSISN